jgi:hypothetical protein
MSAEKFPIFSILHSQFFHFPPGSRRKRGNRRGAREKWRMENGECGMEKLALSFQEDVGEGKM